jgi:multidrug resistance efflux pump
MDNKDKLPPIPTPAAQRWREFRIQILPVVVFGASLFCIVYLWRNFVQPVGIVGLAQTNTVNVTCTVDGLISQVLVEPFQIVTQNQIIAIVQNLGSDVIQAQSEATVAQLEVDRDRIKIGLERAQQNYERYRVDLLQEQISLLTDKARVFFASNEMVRAAQLAKEGIGPQSDADSKKAAFDSLIASISERTIAIDDLAKTVSELQKGLTKSPDVISVDQAIAARRREMEEMIKPTTLKAPISGQVNFVHHYPGEKIIRGTSVASIASPISTNIIGYIRQPITVRPNLNEEVIVSTRTQPRKIVKGKITHIGAQLEAISPSLISVDANRFEWGLPVLVDIEPGFPLIPGEFVILSLAGTAR